MRILLLLASLLTGIAANEAFIESDTIKWVVDLREKFPLGIVCERLHLLCESGPKRYSLHLSNFQSSESPAGSDSPSVSIGNRYKVTVPAKKIPARGRNVNLLLLCEKENGMIPMDLAKSESFGIIGRKFRWNFPHKLSSKHIPSEATEKIVVSDISSIKLSDEGTWSCPDLFDAPHSPILVHRQSTAQSSSPGSSESYKLGTSLVDPLYNPVKTAANSDNLASRSHLANIKLQANAAANALRDLEWKRNEEAADFNLGTEWVNDATEASPTTQILPVENSGSSAVPASVTLRQLTRIMSAFRHSFLLALKELKISFFFLTAVNMACIQLIILLMQNQIIHSIYSRLMEYFEFLPFPFLLIVGEALWIMKTQPSYFYQVLMGIAASLVNSVAFSAIVLPDLVRERLGSVAEEAPVS